MNSRSPDAQHRLLRATGRVAILSIFLLALPGQRGLAAGFSVDSTADKADLSAGDGICDADAGPGQECTLRAAIEEANGLGGAHTISLPGGEYALILGELSFASDISIGGASRDTTIVRTSLAQRLVYVYPTVTVVLADLTLQDGASSAGGCVSNAGNLTLENVTVRDCQALDAPSSVAGGIANLGSLTLDHCLLDNNNASLQGGGIWNYSSGGPGTPSVTIRDSTLTGNTTPHTGQGGAILNSMGTALYVTRSTFRGNSAGVGGAIMNFGEAELSNTTLAGNISPTNYGGAIHVNSNGPPDPAGSLALHNVTLRGNLSAVGGALSSSGIVSIANTIVAGNAPSDCTLGGTWQDGGYNLDGDNTCGLILPSDLPGVDPLVGPLADYGGPTWTFQLLRGSPAINAGDLSGCEDANGNSLTVDQRGVPRHIGGRCDIGAYEAPAYMLLPLVLRNFP